MFLIKVLHASVVICKLFINSVNLFPHIQSKVRPIYLADIAESYIAGSYFESKIHNFPVVYPCAGINFQFYKSLILFKVMYTVGIIFVAVVLKTLSFDDCSRLASSHTINHIFVKHQNTVVNLVLFSRQSESVGLCHSDRSSLKRFPRS